MATTISSHSSTATMMNSIHSVGSVREPANHFVEATHGQPPAIDQVVRSEPYSNPISIFTQGTDFDRVIDHPADLRSNTDAAVIVSSHRTTAATMNSIHTLLSENHP